MKSGVLVTVAAGLALAACTGAAPTEVKTPAAPPASTSAKAGAPAGVDAPLTAVVAPVEPPRMAALARRLAAVIDGAKPQVSTYALDLSALPQVTVHARIDAKEAAKLDRKKLVDEDDLVVKPADGYSRNYMLSFGFKDSGNGLFGHLRVTGTYGPSEGWFGEGFGSSMNTYMTCGGSEMVPVQWETVKLSGDTLTHTISDGVLDKQSCKILRAKQTVAKAKPLLPKGILFGYRACEGSCTESEELTLLFPRSTAAAAGALGGGADKATGSFSVVSFPIQRGGGGSFLARLMRRDVVAWTLQPAAKDASKPAPSSDDAARVNALFLPSFELGVEVSQGNEDEAPIAIAYMDIDPAALAPPVLPSASVGSAPAPAPASRIGFVDPFTSRN